MKFKIGDKVRVKPFEEIEKLPHHFIREDGDIQGECEDTNQYDVVITAHNSFVCSMHEFCEGEYVIEEARETGNYKLANTNNWSFIACWLELSRRYVDSFELESSQHYVEFFDD